MNKSPRCKIWFVTKETLKERFDFHLCQSQAHQYLHGIEELVLVFASLVLSVKSFGNLLPLRVLYALIKGAGYHINYI